MHSCHRFTTFSPKTGHPSTFLHPAAFSLVSNMHFPLESHPAKSTVSHFYRTKPPVTPSFYPQNYRSSPFTARPAGVGSIR